MQVDFPNDYPQYRPPYVALMLSLLISPAYFRICKYYPVSIAR